MTKERLVLDVRESDKSIIFILEDTYNKKRDRLEISFGCAYIKRIGKWEYVCAGDVISYRYEQNSLSKSNPAIYWLDSITDRNGDKIKFCV